MIGAMLNIGWMAVLIVLYSVTGDIGWLLAVPISMTAAIVCAVMDS